MPLLDTHKEDIERHLVLVDVDKIDARDGFLVLGTQELQAVGAGRGCHNDTSTLR